MSPVLTVFINTFHIQTYHKKTLSYIIIMKSDCYDNVYMSIYILCFIIVLISTIRTSNELMKQTTPSQTQGPFTFFGHSPDGTVQFRLYMDPVNKPSLKEKIPRIHVKPPPQMIKTTPKLPPQQQIKKAIPRQQVPKVVTRQQAPQVVTTQQVQRPVTRQQAPQVVTTQQAPQVITTQQVPKVITKQQQTIPQQQSNEWWKFW
jgi:hypothetical protein